MTLVLLLGTRVILLLQDCDRVLKGVGLRNIMQLTALLNNFLSPEKSPELRISPRSRPSAIAACSAEAVCAFASADLRVSAAARRGAAAYGVAS